jgi:hypothetical protein
VKSWTFASSPCVWMTPQGERRADSCYGWNRSSAPLYGAAGKSRRVAINGASGRFELDWRLGAAWQLAYLWYQSFHEASIRGTTQEKGAASNR